MTTWSTIEPLTGEHVEYLRTSGVKAPALASGNRRPTQAEVLSAYAEAGAPEALLVDTYADGAEQKVRVRGDDGAALAFLVALSKRCGQLYMFPFPHDQIPGAVVDPGDDVERALSRLNAETRAAVTE